jgi:hypothetical protein
MLTNRMVTRILRVVPGADPDEYGILRIRKM